MGNHIMHEKTAFQAIIVKTTLTACKTYYILHINTFVVVAHRNAFNIKYNRASTIIIIFITSIYVNGPPISHIINKVCIIWIKYFIFDIIPCKVTAMWVYMMPKLKTFLIPTYVFTLVVKWFSLCFSRWSNTRTMGIV